MRARICLAALMTAVVCQGVNVAQASAALSAAQQSQVRFLTTYTRDKAGAHPTHAEALRIVAADPHVPTMADFKALTPKTSKPKEIPFAPDAAFPDGTTGCVAPPTPPPGPCYPQSREGEWYYAPLDELQWYQTYTWGCEPWNNWAGGFDTSGYPQITGIDSIDGWYWAGEDTSDGFPLFTRGGGGADYEWGEYQWIEFFKWGWGPFTLTVQFDMYEVGYANGDYYGGYF